MGLKGSIKINVYVYVGVEMLGLGKLFWFLFKGENLRFFGDLFEVKLEDIVCCE